MNILFVVPFLLGALVQDGAPVPSAPQVDPNVQAIAQRLPQLTRELRLDSLQIRQVHELLVQEARVRILAASAKPGARKRAAKKPAGGDPDALASEILRQLGLGVGAILPRAVENRLDATARRRGVDPGALRASLAGGEAPINLLRLGAVLSTDVPLVPMHAALAGLSPETLERFLRLLDVRQVPLFLKMLGDQGREDVRQLAQQRRARWLSLTIDAVSAEPAGPSLAEQFKPNRPKKRRGRRRRRGLGLF